MAVHWPLQERAQYYNGVSYAEAAEKRTDRSLGIQSMTAELAPPTPRGYSLLIYGEKVSLHAEG